MLSRPASAVTSWRCARTFDDFTTQVRGSCHHRPERSSRHSGRVTVRHGGVPGAGARDQACVGDLLAVFVRRGEDRWLRGMIGVPMSSNRWVLRRSAGGRRVALGLRWRVALGFALVGAVVTSGFAVWSYREIGGDVVAEREDTAMRQSFANARILRARLDIGEPDPGAVIASLESSQGTPVLRFGGEWFGASLGVSRGDVPESLLRSVAEGDAARQRIRLDDGLTLVVGVPVPAVGAEYYEFVPLDEAEDTLGAVRRSLAIGAIVATVLAALVGAAASGAVLRPLRRVAAAAASVRDGDLATRVSATGDPDLDPLMTTFNAMVDELRQRIDRDTRFTADVSHELRGPLAALSAAAAHARRHANDPDEVRYSLDLLTDTVEEFNALVIDLLEISRIDAGVAELVLEAVHVRDFFEAVVGAERADTVLRIDDDVPEHVTFDKRRIAQALRNLLQNAEHYAGGATDIGVGRDGARLRISVADEGPGVADHEQLYVFERFARGDGARERAAGTGLGLALVAEHVRLHGGTVGVANRAAGGARFTVELPIGGAP